MNGDAHRAMVINNLYSSLHIMNRKFLRFAGIEFAFWATFSMYYPFMVVFLMEKGLDNVTIGTILAVNSGVALLAQPFWGMVSDKVQSIKKVFILCLGVTAILWVTLPLYQTILFMAIAFAVLVFFEGPLPPLLDSWVLQGIKTEKSLTYGTIRLWGSVGFGLTLFLVGKVIDIRGINIIFPMFALLASITIILCVAFRADRGALVIKKIKLEPGRLLKNVRYIAFVIFAMFLIIPNRASFLFLPVLVKNVGGTSGDLSMAISLIAVSEIPVFLFSAYLIKRFGAVKIIFVSAFFFALRQLLFLFVSTPSQIILMQFSHGLSFAFFLPATVYYVDSMAPDNLKATAQTLCFAIFAALGGILASSLGGIVIDSYGLDWMYKAGLYMTIGITGVYALFFYIVNKGDN